MAANVPYLPPLSPYIMARDGFEVMIKNGGIRLSWMKNHACPCTFAGEITGSPDPNCQQCQGIGYYWDTPSDPFFGLLTWVHIQRTPDEPGFFTHGQVGIVQHGVPTLTIPYAADATGTIWTEASNYDAYVELDARTRYNAVLQVGGRTTVPYQQNLTIDPQNAVTTYSPETGTVSTVSGYTVSGAMVSLPNTYPIGTQYFVEFIASPVYISYDKAGGAPHTRPFGGPEGKMPRRFRLHSLDLWLRGMFPNTNIAPLL